MSQKDQSINLLRAHSALSAEEVMLLARIRTISIVFSVVVLVLGLFVGTAFLAAKLRLDGVTNEKANALKLLAFNSRKEALLVSLKERIPLVNLAIKSQYPWDRIIDSVTQVVRPPQLHSLSIDTSNTLTMGIEVGSLEEMNEIIQRTENLVASNRIKFSRIGSLESQKDGKINAVIAFTPIL